MFTFENIVKFIHRQFTWVKGSGDNEPGGASSKKLTGFWFLVCLTGPIVFTWLIYAAWWGKWDLLIPILSLIIGSGLSALGISSLEKTRLAKIEKDKLKNDDAPQP